jgi:hypothetical protein
MNFRRNAYLKFVSVDFRAKRTTRRKLESVKGIATEG